MGNTECPDCRELAARVALLERELNDLKERLSKNSRNSSKPPSSDGLAKPSPRSLRVKSGRRPGGQRGHKGETLKMRADPDEIIVHQVEQCEQCGCLLDEVTATGVEKRQVFDLPPLEIEVIEHQSETKRCPCCGHESTASFPGDVTGPVQYGASIRSIATYLQQYQLLPFDRTRELFEDLFSLTMSTGTLASIINDCSEHVEGAVAQIKEMIRGAAVVHFDESGASVEGQLQWLHAASTVQATYYHIHPKRGSAAMDEIEILPGFEGRAIHDFWKPYLGYACDHGLCNAHLLRELVFLHEEQGQKWAKKMIDHLIKIKDAVDETRLCAHRLSERQLWRFEKRYKRILGMGKTENPYALDESVKRKRGRPKKSKAQNLLDRFEGYSREILAFMYDFRVPFDNNLSERDIRMIKLRMKISGTFRSKEGAKAFCRIRSYISTARKNAVNVIAAIRDAFAGHPFIPTPSPGT
jgi:transposase